MSYKGSKRCMLEFISSPNFILNTNTLIQNTGATISTNNTWMPKGLDDDQEAELRNFLEKTHGLELATAIQNWWLAVATRQSRTPNWDFASTCTIDGIKGLLLVEAKAHQGELENESRGKPLGTKASENSKANHKKIANAINEANVAINKKVRGVAISRDKCYQLSNRIAHAWWLANQGIPVVLLYLGFLKAEDMRNGANIILESPEEWEDSFTKHAQQVGADKLINTRVDCGHSSFITIVKSYN